MRRVKSAQFWLWKNPDSFEMHKARLVGFAIQLEGELYIVRTICETFLHKFKINSEMPPAEGPDSSRADVPFIELGQNLLRLLPYGLAMPRERFLELYASKSFNVPRGEMEPFEKQYILELSRSKWQARKVSQFLFRKWAHKGQNMELGKTVSPPISEEASLAQRLGALEIPFPL
jgi:hypothetical protein